MITATKKAWTKRHAAWLQAVGLDLRDLLTIEPLRSRCAVDDSGLDLARLERGTSDGDEERLELLKNRQPLTRSFHIKNRTGR